MSEATPARPVEPLSGPVDATVPIPGSKSLTNRALVCAALARGTSRLQGALGADDTRAMVTCLRKVGAHIEAADPAPDPGVGAGEVGDHHLGDVTEVVGTAGQLWEGPLDLHVNQSGTTARFLLPVLGVGPGPYRLDGADALRARPMGPTIAALRHLGVEVGERGHLGHLPVVVSGPARSELAEASGSLSSQFVSGLLLAAPCYRLGLEVQLRDELVSRPYVAMTESVMATFGVEVVRVPDDSGPGGYRVAPGGYTAADLRIEPDASSASYCFAAAALAGGRVAVDGLGSRSSQGDLGFVRVLERMGATVVQTAARTEVRGTGELHGIDVDLSDMPDMAQTVAALAVFAVGPTVVRGVGIIRFHETDRLAAVATELGRAGIEVEATDDGWVIHPGTPRPTTFDTYQDHRMAMSLALLGLVAPGIAIGDPGCVAKTFPGFWDVLDQLRSGSLPAAG